MASPCAPNKRRRREDSGGSIQQYMHQSNDDDIEVEKEEDLNWLDRITLLLETRRWKDAEALLLQTDDRISSTVYGNQATPLALACRHGAPLSCVTSILNKAPQHVRRVLDARGTPLHEAIVCEHHRSCDESDEDSTGVITALLAADEKLSSTVSAATSAASTADKENYVSPTRAALLQDVDGFTPLHLLIRRRFQSHILRLSNESYSGSRLMQILEMLVRSCPEAVVIPDRGEYEEPPIVYAVKANVYAPGLGTEDETVSRVEAQIHEIVDCMLRYNPAAASRVFKGYRGQYSALHSAVFHGRYTGTIDLLLQVEARTLEPGQTRQASLLQNTQGEIPLHFCAMRGERPSAVALIARAAPQAVSKRDTSGLTPFHWLWIRFISTQLALENGMRGSDASFVVNANRTIPQSATHYDDFAWLEQGNFDTDFQLIRRMDPPADFLRMRHIPEEVVVEEDSLRRVGHSVGILKHLRERHSQSQSNDDDADVHQPVQWSRDEAVTALFWTKVVSLLRAANHAYAQEEHMAGGAQDGGENAMMLAHMAFANKCCPPPVAYMVASLFPNEMSTPDSYGRLPLHHAARRVWDRWDFAPHGEDESALPTASRLLHRDSLSCLRLALLLTPQDMLSKVDVDGRLALHHMIDAMVTSANTTSTKSGQISEMLELVRKVIQQCPGSLRVRDGSTNLYPFLQAAAGGGTAHQELSVSLCYNILRCHPSFLEEVRKKDN